jgi:hypothetical protein
VNDGKGIFNRRFQFSQKHEQQKDKKNKKKKRLGKPFSLCMVCDENPIHLMSTAKRLKGELEKLQAAGFDVTLDTATKWRVALHGGHVVINFPPGYPFVGFEIASSLSRKDIRVDVGAAIPRRPLSELLGFANEELHDWPIVSTGTKWHPQKTVVDLLSREVPIVPLWIDGKFGLHEHWQVAVFCY